MKKILKLVLAFVLFLNIGSISFAHDNLDIPPRPNKKIIKDLDKLLDERLHLTDEQKQQLKQMRPRHKAEMEQVVKQMKICHLKIRNVYLSGIPPYQAGIKTAPYKAQLAILNQNAMNLKDSHRKEFEKILTPEQKIEFEKLREERKKH